ncbi:flagellar basal-body rod protein FlgF [Roseibium algicola]|jgi:flagellar basal-body rod protein FlgF|uniref:Flagellar basal-body rod protein FlgF n=1 Tax=Roseibium algicola TaxID=2857014 RepID=A0ABN4X2N8_9HYPH|nr:MULTISPECIES: flagellar basal-body rod protein FlgF [Stappiaceae]AMN52766.1 flagellar basal body rod protein [Labrenzia sp. CP4]AQQ05965.1 flagellar basal-body rod protein FlgF [Roseibium aggregatum]WJS04753.1 flagellar basal-body rod protein FlgF [Roseibium aggregatum]
MENAQLVALSRQSILRNHLDVIANNMANINTSGFKSQNLHFSEYVMPVADGSAFEPQDRAISYVDMFTTRTDFTHGPIKMTGNEFDLSLNSDGFFAVQMPDGTEAYTRSGAFRLDSTGQLISADGSPVMTDQGPISFNDQDGRVEIAQDGTISTRLGIRGRIKVVDFEDVRTMEKIGNTMFKADNPIPAQEVRMVQGAVEGSNVYGITEVTRLIEVTRAYDSTSKIVKDLDELRRQAISTLGKIQA